MFFQPLRDFLNNEKFEEKIFCALDFSEMNETVEFVKLIREHIGGIKAGIEFFLKMELME